MTDQQPRVNFRAWTSLIVLMLIYTVYYIDRVIFNVVAQAVKGELGLSDFEVGLLGGAAFAVLGALATIPIARIAERRNRVAILVVSLSLWSIMTAVCGLARNVLHLAIARVFVGIGEAGSVPASQSLVSDFFPAERRATALGVLMLGVPLGTLIGAFGSGWVTQNLSWRAAFFWVGIPGVILALALPFLIKEPARGRLDPVAAGDKPLGFWVLLGRLWRRPTFVNLLIGMGFMSFGNYGLWQFMHPFFVRNFHVTYVQAALAYGLIVGISSALGSGLGGVITDAVSRKHPGRYLLVPTLCLLAAGPLLALALVQPDWLISAALFLLPGIAVGTSFGPVFGAVHSLADARSRATVTAILITLSSLTGLGLGPPMVGFLSDHFSALAFAGGDFATACLHAKTAACAAAGSLGLRNALIVDGAAYSCAGVFYGLASRCLLKDQAASH